MDHLEPARDKAKQVQYIMILYKCNLTLYTYHLILDKYKVTLDKYNLIHVQYHVRGVSNDWYLINDKVQLSNAK